MFGPYVHPILLCAICVIVSVLRPELFEFGQPNVFTSYVTISHVVYHARHPRRTLNQQTQPESVELRPVPRRARVSVVEPQVAETQPLI